MDPASVGLSPAIILGAAKTGRQYRILDDEVDGLFLRVTAGGRKSFGIRVRIRGRQVEMTIGSAEKLPLLKARKLAKHRIAEVMLNEVEERFAPTPTVKTLVEAYQRSARWQALSPKTQKTYSSMIDRIILPKLGRKYIGEVKRAEISGFYNTVYGAHGGATCATCRSVLVNVWNLALDQSVTEYNVAQQVRSGYDMIPRNRILSSDEIGKLMLHNEANRLRKPQHTAVLEFMMFTGQRRVEVVEMTWQEVDLDLGIWILPRTRVKNDRPHLIPLTPSAIAILRRMLLVKKPDPKARVFSVNPDAVTQYMKRLTKKWLEGSAGPHDIRRTMVTTMPALGIEQVVIQRIINHQTSEPIRHYNHHAYQAEKRKALEIWETHVRECMRPAAAIAA